MRWRVVVAALALSFAGAAGAQSDWPKRPIRLVVPFPPGGPTDIVARPLAQKLTEALGQTVLIDNRAGAGGGIGADSVAKAPPDGYTLLVGTVGTHAINPSLYAKLGYDAAGDFTPITLVAAAPVLLVANPAANIRSARDLVTQARSSPNQLTYGSAGSGTPGHLTGEIFKSTAGAPLMHVPYKGSAPAINDLLGGQIPLMFDPIQSVLPHVKSGKLVALATSGSKRTAALPSVPTFAEAGVSAETAAWWGVFAPARTPPEIVAKLHSEILRALQSADVHDKLQAAGIEPIGGGPVAFASYLQSEMRKWGKAVQDSGARVD